MYEGEVERIATIEYWDENARWYDLWFRHNNYHQKIIEVLTGLARPGWRVLDIGGGGGVLSLPLAEGGCNVTIIEPSRGMRNLLRHSMEGKNARGCVALDHRTWEETDHREFSGFDLILACNSLHLTGIGFEDALKKVFLARPKRAMIVTETVIPDMNLRPPPGNYNLSLFRSFETESSYVYHSMEEACEHRAFRVGRPPNDKEKADLRSDLSYTHGHFRLTDKAIVHIYWWDRKEV
jgi:SAM-dependent methyltransferase